MPQSPIQPILRLAAPNASFIGTVQPALPRMSRPRNMPAFAALPPGNGALAESRTAAKQDSTISTHPSPMLRSWPSHARSVGVSGLERRALNPRPSSLHPPPNHQIAKSFRPIIVATYPPSPPWPFRRNSLPYSNLRPGHPWPSRGQLATIRHLGLSHRKGEAQPEPPRQSTTAADRNRSRSARARDGPARPSPRRLRFPAFLPFCFPALCP